jgi:hypothetical protein
MNEIYLFSSPRPIRSLYSAVGWTWEAIAEHALPALKPSFMPIELCTRAFIPSCARSRYSPMCKTALAYDTRAGNGMPSAHDAGAVLYNGLRVVEDRGGTPG